MPNSRVDFRFYGQARNYLAALALSGLCTATAYPWYPSCNVTSIAMLYLLGTMFAALRLGRGPAVLMSVANIVSLDYFFIPPLFSLEVESAPYGFTLAVAFIVALVIANLTAAVRRERSSAEARERRASVLSSMSRDLCVASDAAGMSAVAARHIERLFNCAARVFIVDERGSLAPAPLPDAVVSDARLADPPFDIDIVREVISRRTARIADAVYLPLEGNHQVKGVLAVRPRAPLRAFPSEQLILLEACAAQLALALQRARLAQTVEVARREAEHAVLRNTLLSSVSHDLRTPLSAIAGAGSLIAQPDYALNADRRATLGRLIERKAHDMSHLLSNILELAKMEFGAGALRTDWHSVDELVAHSLRVNQARLTQRRIEVTLPEDLPLVLVDATLIVQILNNLLENSAKYTPAGTTITISAAVAGESLLLTVADDGPGLPAGDPDRMFERYRRGESDTGAAGAGLGLAICRAAARLHGGEIRAANSPGGGACFEIRLPVQMLVEKSPQVELDYMSATV